MYTHCSSSNNSTTPVMDKTETQIFAEEEEQQQQQTSDLPESTHLPVLNTGPSPGAANYMVGVQSNLNDSQYSQHEESKGRKISNGNKPQQLQQQHPQQPNGGSRAHRLPPQSPNNRRMEIDELFLQHQLQQQQIQLQQAYYHGIPPPPPQMHPLPGSYHGPFPIYNLNMPQNPHMMPHPRVNVPGQRQQQVPSQQMPTPTHHRVRSLPLVPQASLPGLSSAGNPLIPNLPDAEGGINAERRSRSNTIDGSRDHRRVYSGNTTVDVGHRRSNSGNAPIMYGSFDDGARQHTNAGKFSPRQEIMKLSKGYSSRSQQQLQSPRASPRAPALRQPQQGHGHENLHVSFSSSTPIQNTAFITSSVRGFDPDPNFTGEVFYQPNRRNKSRKMHMRQQSAQIFMEPVKGVRQEAACRDVFFVLLFLLHLSGVAFLGSMYGHDAYIGEHYVESGQAVKDLSFSYRNVIFVTGLCGLFGVVVSTLALVIMTMIVKRLVQVSLILTIALSFAWGTIGIGVSPQNVVPITGIIALMLSVGYTLIVWDRLPFASANLQAGMSGVRANSGTVILAFVFQGLSLWWTIYFVYVLLGVYNAVDRGELDISDNMTIVIYVSLGISYYWTYNVLLNITQVTVAGAIGSWWFNPEGSHAFCTEAVTESFFSVMFYKLGSICFGSLLLGPVKLIRMLGSFFRPSSDEYFGRNEILLCVQECITGCVYQLSSRFSPWALTYVGLYGYSLCEAGEHSTELFEKRGWTKIVSDDLISNVLLMVSVVVGGVTGCFGVLIQKRDELIFSSLHERSMTAFLIGFCIGLVVTSVLFGIISSSVQAVIVCFAGNPVEFEKNHPELSTEMRSAWREVWPGCMDVDDARAEYANIVKAYHQQQAAAGERHPLL